MRLSDVGAALPTVSAVSALAGAETSPVPKTKAARTRAARITQIRLRDLPLFIMEFLFARCRRSEPMAVQHRRSSLRARQAPRHGAHARPQWRDFACLRRARALKSRGISRGKARRGKSGRIG